MKKTFILLISILFIQISYSQSINRIAGVYHLQSGSHDPQGGVNLILTDTYQYAYAYFGGIDIGTWKECDGNIIMQPDTTNSDAYYVSGRINPEIPEDSIYIFFSGVTDSPGLCSFDHFGKNSAMHPVYNKNPNCLTGGKLTLKKGLYDEFSMMSAPEVYENIEYDTEVVDWKEALANYLKEKKRTIADTDTITGIKYTFPFSASYNEFHVSFNPTGDKFLFPSLGTFQDTKLYINSSVFRKSRDLSSLSDSDKEFIKQLSLVGTQRLDMTDSEFQDLSKSRLIESGLTPEEADSYLSQMETKDKPISHIRKDKVRVNYDLRNMITNTCYHHNKSQRRNYIE